MVPFTNKCCAKCGENNPITEFNKDAQKRDGLSSYCKACLSIAKSKYSAANIEKIRVASKKYRAANREKCKTATAKWTAANPDKVKANRVTYYAANTAKVNAATAKYYADHTDKMKASIAAWYTDHPEARRIYKHNRRAREAGSKLSIGLAEKLLKLQRGKCACGCKQPLGADYHLDHRMPLALGGANEDWNIQLLRQRCNNQKHAKHPIEFMQSRGFLL